MSGNISGDKQGSWGPFWKRRWLLASRCQADNFFLRYFCVKFIIIYYISSTAIFPTSGSNVAIPALLARRHATSDSTKLSFFFFFFDDNLLILESSSTHSFLTDISRTIHISIRVTWAFLMRVSSDAEKGEGDINGAKR